MAKRARYGNALLLAAGQLRREILRPVVQADKVDDLRRVHGVFAYLRGKLNVFNGREVLYKVIKLEHKARHRSGDRS